MFLKDPILCNFLPKHKGNYYDDNWKSIIFSIDNKLHIKYKNNNRAMSVSQKHKIII